jgi:hypothetical protein
MLPGSTIFRIPPRDHHGFNADEPRERSITGLSSMQTMELAMNTYARFTSRGDFLHRTSFILVNERVLRADVECALLHRGPISFISISQTTIKLQHRVSNRTNKGYRRAVGC